MLVICCDLGLLCSRIEKNMEKVSPAPKQINTKKIDFFCIFNVLDFCLSLIFVEYFFE